MNICPMRKKDLPSVAELERELFSDAWSESALSDCLCQHHYAMTVCVEDEGKVLGYLISTHVAGEAEILRIGVFPNAQGQGIGKALMEEFVRICARRETPSAFLEVRASNQRARNLYSRYGFSLAGRRKEYYRDPIEDACLMSAKLDAVGGQGDICPEP